MQRPSICDLHDTILQTVAANLCGNDISALLSSCRYLKLTLDQPGAWKVFHEAQPSWGLPFDATRAAESYK
jgi:hypothetical protein